MKITINILSSEYIEKQQILLNIRQIFFSLLHSGFLYNIFFSK